MSDRRARFILLAITALAAAIRFSTLDLQSYWYDEVATLYVLDGSLDHFWSALRSQESTPPLYYLIAKGWTEVFGNGEVGLRSLSALLGTMTVPAAYLLAREVASRTVALTTALLMALGGMLVWFSQETRAYALLSLLATVGAWCFLRALDRATGRRLAAWAAVSVLALLTHYFAAFLVIPQMAWLVLVDRRRPAVLAAVGAVGATGLALLPLALEQRSSGKSDWIGQRALAPRVTEFLSDPFLSNTNNSFVMRAVTTGVVLLALVLLVDRVAPPALRRLRPLVAITGVAVAWPVVLALGGLDLILARNLIGAVGPFAVLLAAGLLAPRAQPIGVAALVLLCCVCLASLVGTWTDPDRRRPDWRGAVADLPRAPLGRAYVTTPIFGHSPVAFYRPRASTVPSGGGVLVGEILVVDAPDDPPSSRRPPDRFGLFRAIERKHTAGWTRVRYRAPRPVPMNAASLGPLALRGGQFAVVYEPPPPDALGKS